MNLMFWKKKPSQDEAGNTAPGLLARIKAPFAALAGRFKSPPPFQAEVDEDSAKTETRSEVNDSGALARLRSIFKQPFLWFRSAADSRTKLYVGAALLVIFLLTAFGLAVWKIFLSSPDHDTDLLKDVGAQHAPLPIDLPSSEPAATEPLIDTAASAVEAIDEPAASAVPVETTELAASSAAAAIPADEVEHPAPVSDDTPEAEIARLRKEKAELQKKLNALRNEQRQTNAANRLDRGKAPTIGGSVTVQSDDPKGTVETLKSAIDAMNAGTGDYPKKNEKRPLPDQPEKAP